MGGGAARIRRIAGPRHAVPLLLPLSFMFLALLASVATVFASPKLDEYEGRTITAVEITFEGSPSEPAAEAEFLSIIKVIPNTQFSAVAVRDSLQALFDSERVANARVEVVDGGNDFRKQSRKHI